jgi:Protein of unknown function (DUF1488)
MPRPLPGGTTRVALPDPPRARMTQAYRKNHGAPDETARGSTVALTFPNRSRFYDATRRAVRFWGHDSAMESSFFVSVDSLKRLQPDLRCNEPGLLAAFDFNRDSIQTAAAKVYARGRKGSYDLLIADF